MTTQGDIGIINQSLVLLGSETIDSLDDFSDVSRSAFLIYPKVKTRVLSVYDWRVSKRKRELAREADFEPPSPYDYSYQLPSDFKTGPLSVEDLKSNIIKSDWEVMGKHFLSSEEKIIISYLRDADVSDFPPYLVDLLVNALASELAIPITEMRSRADHFQQIAWGTVNDNFHGGLCGEAMRIESQTRQNKFFSQSSNPLVNVR